MDPWTFLEKNLCSSYINASYNVKFATILPFIISFINADVCKIIMCKKNLEILICKNIQYIILGVDSQNKEAQFQDF